MKNKSSDKLPTIIDNREIFCDNEYMSRERIKSECKCIKSSVCQALCDLLRNNQIKWAYDLLDYHKKQWVNTSNHI